MSAPQPHDLALACEDAGFAWAAGQFRRGELALTPSGSWLEARWTDTAAATPCGLWKRDAADAWSADLPLAVLGDVEADRLPGQVAAVAQWLEDSARGRPSRAAAPAGDVPPADATAAAEWTVRCGSVLRTIEIATHDACVVVRCPLTDAAATPGVGAAQAAFEDVADAWQRATRMCRVVRTGDAFVAEVELTGAPPELLSGLVAAGAACLRAALPLLLPVVDLLGDPHVSLDAPVDDFPGRSVSAGGS